jgi:predicted TIM-barrel fold metal-dependent hydrolase
MKVRVARVSVVLALLLVAIAIACSAVRSCVVGGSDSTPAELEDRASPAARALVARALEGLDAARLFDVHAHVAGSEADSSGCELNPAMRSYLHPWRRFQLWVYLAAAGVEHLDHGADELAARLLAVSKGRVAILALDHRYREDGTVDREGTAVYVPNDHVFRLADAHARVFVPVASVHPYRKDALEELDRCAARGARLVKWEPNSMGIDPASPLCDAFYERMKLRGMTLLSHAGEEHALMSGASDVGNPLRLRRALDHGVRVIIALCGSLGDGEDLDNPAHKKVASFDLFLRVMDDPRYRDLAFGDISAVCFRNREPRVLKTLLERTDLHARLIDGTDWPLPAIRILTSTSRLVREGLLTEPERAALDEVFDYNPRLFDLVLKRTLRGPKGERFPASVFLAKPELVR